MDNLVLVGVVAALAETLPGAILDDVRQETAQRLRLTLRHGDGRQEWIAICWRAEMPWLGRPAGKHDGPPWSPSSFVTRIQKELRGLRLERIEKLGPGRAVALTFRGGRALIAELATHGANLILLDSEGRIEQAAHHPRSAQTRLAAGVRYAAPSLPAGKLIVDAVEPHEIDAFLRAKVREGEEPFEALRRHVFGVGSAAALLVLAEVESSGRTAGEVLISRWSDVVARRSAPVVEAADDLQRAAELGPLDPQRVKLWPWPPPHFTSGNSLIERGDAAGTAGLFYHALERGEWVASRAEALRAILRQELRRAIDVERRAEGDLRGFEDPEAWGRRGEALLAGLAVARRSGDHVFVPDPYDPAARDLAIAAPPGMALTLLAETCFSKQRRARRGLESASARLATLTARRERLQRLGDEWNECALQAAEVERNLGAALRREGIAVGITAGTRALRQARSVALPRREGLRLLESRDGMTILVGKTGPDNDRLTFKIAGPEDFWFHAQGRPGAHVVVRNPERLRRPPPATLDDAAAVAAWYSEGRGDGAVDVQWTRRKHVRRAPGRAPGTVLVKRYETIRTTPRSLADES